MTVRTLGLVSMLVTLAVTGWLFTQQAKDVGPTSTTATQAEAQASAEVATANFQAAAPELQAWYAEHGTYAGATLAPAFGVVLARADATSYCLQAGSGTTVQHQTGPGGAVQPGPC